MLAAAGPRPGAAVRAAGDPGRRAGAAARGRRPRRCATGSPSWPPTPTPGRRWSARPSTGRWPRSHPAVDELADAADEQVAAADGAGRAGHGPRTGAPSRTVEQGLQDGRLLRGEVLARWQEFVGTGELMRTLQARIGRLRDRVVAAVTGRPAPGRELRRRASSRSWSRCCAGVAAEAAEQRVHRRGRRTRPAPRCSTPALRAARRRPARARRAAGPGLAARRAGPGPRPRAATSGSWPGPPRTR